MSIAIDFREQIKLLIELQGLDSEVMKREEALKAIPIEMKAQEDSYKAKQASLKAIEENVKALTLQRKGREGDLETKEQSIKKYQSQLSTVKTNKEYSALLEEIGRIKADNSLIEEDILKLFDQIDAENQKMIKEKERLKQEEVVFASEKKKLEDEANRVKVELDKVIAQRSVHAAKIDAKILSKYEKLLKSRDGLALVPVKGDACQGCFRVMPQQVINEIRMNAGIIVCESCARMLYIEE